jgi:hypothetical protein
MLLAVAEEEGRNSGTPLADLRFNTLGPNRHLNFPRDEIPEIPEVRGMSLVAAGCIIRSQPRGVTVDILDWASEQWREPDAPGHVRIRRCVEEIADELADALATFRREDVWRSFSDHVVLTGGLGIHFLSASDDDPDGFMARLSWRMPGTHVYRSRIPNAMEREVLIFLNQLD